jgi:hypothetical protein
LLQEICDDFHVYLQKPAVLVPHSLITMAVS